MIILSRHTKLTVVTLATLAIQALPSEARIRCESGYQIVGNRHIASPFCADEYLAQVAKRYGVRVSAASLRRSFEKKSEICRLVGQDNRVRDICTGFHDDFEAKDSGDDHP